MLSFHVLVAKEGRTEVFTIKDFHSVETIDKIVLGFGTIRNLGITFVLMTF